MESKQKDAAHAKDAPHWFFSAVMSVLCAWPLLCLAAAPGDVAAGKRQHRNLFLHLSENG